jgi:non-heme chloroperoxidase
MGIVTVGRENSTPIELYYEDHGAGPPVVLIHGFPFDCHAWEKQTAALLNAGHRVIVYDRRGFGSSSQPTCGYDYDTLASDFNTLVTTLDLHEAVLAGHGMGTGEIVRYVSTYGSDRVMRAALISPIQPYLLKAFDNPEGLEAAMFDRVTDAIRRDRAAYIAEFLTTCFNADFDCGTCVSAAAVQDFQNNGMRASAKGTADCVTAWLTDFRVDLPRIDVPVLVVAGGRDRIFPFNVTGQLLDGALPRSKTVLVAEAPHGLLWSHADEVNRALLDFIDA